MKIRKTVSAAVVQKNQENAKKSTGPKTAQGKQNSRFNAVSHGLTAKRLMFTAEGVSMDNGLAEIVEALRARYDSGDIVTELLIDNIVVDYWRQCKGLEAEMKYFSRNGDSSFHPRGFTSTIQRYNTANRRALLKNLEILGKTQARAHEPEDMVIASDESDGTPEQKQVQDEAERATPESAPADEVIESSEEAKSA
jgi:hypothetical protein